MKNFNEPSKKFSQTKTRNTNFTNRPLVSPDQPTFNQLKRKNHLLTAHSDSQNLPSPHHPLSPPKTAIHQGQKPIKHAFGHPSNRPLISQQTGLWPDRKPAKRPLVGQQTGLWPASKPAIDHPTTITSNHTTTYIAITLYTRNHQPKNKPPTIKPAQRPIATSARPISQPSILTSPSPILAPHLARSGYPPLRAASG